MLTTFARNLNRYASEAGKTRKEISVDLGIPYTTKKEAFQCRIASLFLTRYCR